MGMVMKKTAQNDITGDWLQSKPNNKQFEKNFDLIFKKKKKKLNLQSMNLINQQAKSKRKKTDD